jgi:hypothetical protein
MIHHPLDDQLTRASSLWEQQSTKRKHHARLEGVVVSDLWRVSVLTAARLMWSSSVAAKVCCALPEFESITSDSFRIIYRCGGCGLGEVCIACAHKCHIQHCLELAWTLENTLSRECSCFSSGKCMFDMERGADSGSPDTLDD